MGQASTARGIIARASLGAFVLAAFLLAFSSIALAGEPFHPRTASLDVTGLNHACGVATDSKGDLYAASAGASAIKLYNPSHVLLTEITDANTPCGLAVTTTGNLYVSERATGKVVRFKPNAYPFVGTPTYGSAEEIDKSGKAKGIAVDRFDNRLYVAALDHVAIYNSEGSFEANLGEGTLSEASGVAAYSYKSGAGSTERIDHYLWAADAKGIEADRLYLFGGKETTALKLRRELNGATTPDGSFGFGPSGAYLAADPGNRNTEGKCVVVGEQACSAGHIFLYDAAHKALDEFDASGAYLDRTANAAFADAEPTQVAVERSGTANDGTLYVTAGGGAGAKALAFGPLKAPSRKTLKKPEEEAGGLSHILENVRGIATDSRGDAYASGGALIHVYDPKGTQITTIEDPGKPRELAVDSTGKVYVLDENGGFSSEYEVTYYTPSKYPPDSKTTYTRREEPVATPESIPAKNNILQSIAINPCPGVGKDRLFLTANTVTQLYDSAANGSGLLNEKLSNLTSSFRQTLAVGCGSPVILYIGVNGSPSGRIFGYALNEAGTEAEEQRMQFEPTGGSGETGNNPNMGVDQSNGHVVVYVETKGPREYDATGSFVTEFGALTPGIGIQLAVDSACALHEPPLSETTTPTCKEFDPANGTAYVAWDDPSKEHPPYDVNAFGPLRYPEPGKHKLTVEKTGDGAGTITSEPPGIECLPKCSAEFEETKVITLSATPGLNSEFKGWTGCEAEPSGTKCEVTMSKDRTVTAKFKSTATEKVPLKVTQAGEGTGTVSSSPEGIDCGTECEAEFGKDEKVTLTAAEDEGSEFVGWSGGCVGSEPTCEVTMTGAKEVEAEFGVEHPLLTVVKEGAGTGAVTSDSPGIDCGGTCSHKFDMGEEVTLEVEPDEGSVFAGWSGCDAEPSETECEVTMDKPRKVTATFDALPGAIARPAQPILYDEATLRGEVDPAGLETEYRFEYLTEEEYEDNGESFTGAQHTPTGELAPVSGFVAVEAPLFGLEEATEYRFRLRAMNSVGSAADEGPPFETLQRRASRSCPNAEYRFGLSANLPDCRAYELVTPGQTNGLAPFAVTDGGTSTGSFNNWLTVQRGEGAGGRLSYFTGGTLPGFEGNGILDGYRAERGAGEHPAGGWQSVLFSPGYLESAPGFGHLPTQHGVAADQLYSVWQIDPEAEVLPQTFDPGVYLRTPAGFEALGRGSKGTDLEALTRYVSAGGSHVIFVSKEHLEEEAVPKGTEAIYDRTAGEVSATVVSTKPDGSPFGAGENATYAGASEDGAAIVFSVGGVLYLHRESTTVEIAKAPNTFAGISEDGTRVFYAASASHGVAAGLYACDAEAGPCAGPGAHSPAKIAAAGIFAEVSPGGSHAFFTSTEVLTGGEENDNGEGAQAGAPNLYAWDGVATSFVGRLSASDLTAGGGLTAWTRTFTTGVQSGRAEAPVRSTPDGSVFVFQSHARLTAYDNEGVGEIYRYDSAAEAGKRLLCVSCDPSGAPPSADALLEDIRGIILTPKTMIANLTDSGQEVFFQSFDRLLPEDANEAEDVYEWTAQGAGKPECTRPGGCLSLISSGQGETPSLLYAMSADGHDVFIQTKEKLVGADVAGSPSIYDARVGGGIPEPVEPAPCQGDACQGQGSEPPILPTPLTAGAGESSAAPAPPKPCAKGKHRVKGRCVGAKHKHRKRRHRRAPANRGGKR